MPAERTFWTDAAWEALPLVLAGPILRRADTQMVSVWLATRAPCTARVRVFEGAGGAAVLEGSAELTQLGERLFVGVVVARPLLGPVSLRWGETYQIVTETRESPGDFARIPGLNTLAWGDWEVPTLQLPARSLSEVRIAHGSCRKVHGGYRTLDDDGLRILDRHMKLLSAHDLSAKRPQMLFLTGDQVYADDLPPDYLRFVGQTAKRLMGNVLEVQATPDPVPLPGLRGLYIQNAGFSAGVGNDNAVSSSHLVTLGEFYAHYLLAWSPELWNHATQKPTGVHHFQRWTASVRRALANVTTYMSADDHEVTDDWYMNERWVRDLKDVGRDIITNALVAFAMFQAWGNDPLSWEGEQSPGRILLNQLVASRRVGAARPPWQNLSGLLGVPVHKTLSLSPLEPEQRLALHFAWRGPEFEVIGLDTRTWRSFPSSKDGLAPARLLSRDALETQIPSLHPTTKLTVLISPAPVFLLWFLDWLVESRLVGGDNERVRQNARYEVDYEGWNHRGWGCQALLQRLAERNGHNHPVVALSGDVHHGYAVEVDYSTSAWLEERANAAPKSLRFIQLVSSACRNQEMKALAAGGATGAEWLRPVTVGLSLANGALGPIRSWAEVARQVLSDHARTGSIPREHLFEHQEKILAILDEAIAGSEVYQRDAQHLITHEVAGDRHQTWFGICASSPARCEMLPALAWDFTTRGVPTTLYSLRFPMIDVTGGESDGAQPAWLAALAEELGRIAGEHAETVEVALSRTVLARLVSNLAVAEPHIALVSFPGGASVRQQFVLARRTGARVPSIASVADIPLSRMTGVQP